MNKKLLFLIPFAGGSSLSYSKWKKELTKDFEVYLWDSPGKGGRCQESRNKIFKEEVQDLTNYIGEKTKKGVPYIILGHSMGGIIVYETIFEIRKREFEMPEKVFFSSVMPPNLFFIPDTRNMKDEELMEYLLNIGCAEKSVMPYFKDFLKVIRCDFEIGHTYKFENKEILNLNAYVMYGKEDQLLDSRLQTWNNYFCKTVKFRQFEGAHFYFRDNLAEVLMFVKTEINSRG